MWACGLGCTSLDVYDTLLRLVHTSRRSLRLSQRARPLQVAAKIWKIFYLATVYRRSQQIRSVV